jgi:hypothetical protein
MARSRTGRAIVYRPRQAFGIAPPRPATNQRAFMTLADLDRPAELTLWPGHAPARTADARSFPTLRAALAAAAKAIQTENAKPWIITEAGDILAPGWIRANAVTRQLQ